jgi:hypothetical protein
LEVMDFFYVRVDGPTSNRAIRRPLRAATLDHRPRGAVLHV